jgi:hypothetical protein
MKFSRNKSKVTTVALVLVLTFSAILAALPIVGAHDPPWTVPTWTYINASPNPIGLGQEAIVVYWSNLIPPTASGAYGDRWTFTVEVTKPDGSKETLGPWESDPVGGGYLLYTPDQVGTYTFVAIMDDHVMTGEPFIPGWGPASWGYDSVNDTYLGDTSDPYYLTVQEDPIEGWEETPLPKEYWTRPISSLNRDWWQVTGNWLAGAAQTNGATDDFGYGPGPESAHIMWTKPYWAGGIMDYRTVATGFQTYHYQGLTFSSPIILYGKLYYDARVTAHTTQGYYCVDLYTGETLYYENNTKPAFGSIYNYDSPNQHGGFPYLWRTSGVGSNTWEMLDGFTGNPITRIENVPAGLSWFGFTMPWGTAVYGKDGSILRYNIVNLAPYGEPADNYLQCWNASAMPSLLTGTTSSDVWQWRPAGHAVHDGNQGWPLNVSIPALSGSILAVREGQFVIGGTSGTNRVDEPLVLGNLWCLSLERGQEGTLLWNRTFTPPYDEIPSTALGIFGQGGVTGLKVDPEDGVFIFSSLITRERWGYSLDTMEMLWGPSEPESSFNVYGFTENIYQGMILSYGYGGELIAYNITTGEVLWKYTATGVGYESPYGNYPMGIGCIADGKIYIGTGEHSPTQPLYRGPVLQCINASNGALLWNFPVYGVEMWAGNAGDNFAIADGYLIALNAYDNQIYCFGKGPSATTVTAPETTIPLGEEVLIKGTVTDQSAGTKQQEQAARFPNGVPAISDEHMGEWMEYLYQQQINPKDATGVEVVLTTLDPNGNFYEIDSVTSDASGMFKLMWEPPVPGEYTIIATFEGSKAYYSSYAETAIGVTEAPTPYPEAPTAEDVAQKTIDKLPAYPEVPSAEDVAQETINKLPAYPEIPEYPEYPEAPEYTTIDLAIIAAVVIAIVIGVVNFYALRKRK